MASAGPPHTKSSTRPGACPSSAAVSAAASACRSPVSATVTAPAAAARSRPAGLRPAPMTHPDQRFDDLVGVIIDAAGRMRTGPGA